MQIRFLRKSSVLLLSILILPTTLLFGAVLLVNARPSIGEYIVTEWGTGNLCKISSSGFRTVLYAFPRHTVLGELEIDISGNFIIAEYSADVLSKITPTGLRTVIYEFDDNSGPDGIAIDIEGN